MAYGFRAFNDAGRTQFDNSTLNLVARVKGSHSSATNYVVSGSSRITRLDIDITNYPSLLVAVRPTSSGVWQTFYVERSATLLSIYYRVSNNTQTMDWFGFEYAPSAAPSGFGMKIHDASARMVWNTNYRLMQIKAVESAAITTPTGAGLVTYSAAGRTLAALSGKVSGWTGWIPITDDVTGVTTYRQRGTYTTCGMNGSGNLTIQETTMFQTTTASPSPGSDSYLSPRNQIIIDVTGI